MTKPGVCQLSRSTTNQTQNTGHLGFGPPKQP
jgi:hypothetical protein